MKELQIDYVPLDEIAGWPGNPKDHDVFFLTESIEQHGFKDPMAVDVDRDKLIEGHGRRKALQRLRDSGKPVPEGIQEGDDGDWLAPVVFLRFASEAEAEAYMLAHNKAVERGGWNEDKLAEFFQRQYAERGEVTGTGFTQSYTEGLVRALQARQGTEADKELTFDDGAGPKPPDDIAADPGATMEYEPSGTRFVQVIVEAEHYDAFVEDIYFLKDHYQVDNTSDAIQSAVEDQANRLRTAQTDG